MAKSPSLLSKVPFGSYLVYSPRGQSTVSKNSRDLCYKIKQDRAGVITEVVRRLAQDFAGTELDVVLGPDVMLVPAPRSTPLLEDALWPAARIADELHAARLGRQPRPIVTRAVPVAKSAFAARGGRPSPQQHLDSLRLESRIPLSGRVSVIDDVITRGATMLAVASLITRAYPGTTVAAFALVRTMSFVSDIKRIRAPVVGAVRVGLLGEPAREP